LILEHTPGTGVRDIEVIAALLRREFRTGLAGDEAAEHRLLTLELARRIIGVDPVGDFILISGLYIELSVD
jgi:hypothetical protein